MATYVSELEVAKKNLSEALGENVKQYWANLKLWFKQKISKEEFDLEARRLLTQDNVHSHNDFLLAILTRCQILVSAPGLATHFDLRASKSDTQGWVDHIPFASKERRRSEKKKCVRKKEMGLKRQLKTEESNQRDSPNHLSFSLLAKKIKY